MGYKCKNTLNDLSCVRKTVFFNYLVLGKMFFLNYLLLKNFFFNLFCVKKMFFINLSCVRKMYIFLKTFLDPFLLVVGGDLLAVCFVFGEGFFCVTTCSVLFVGDL